MSRLNCCCMGLLLCLHIRWPSSKDAFQRLYIDMKLLLDHDFSVGPPLWQLYSFGCSTLLPTYVSTHACCGNSSLLFTSTLLPTYVPTHVPTHACSSATYETETVPTHLYIACLQGATCMLQLDMSTSQPRFTLMLQADPVLTACSYVGLYHVILLFLQNLHLHHHGQVGGRTLGYLKLSAVLRPSEPSYNLFAGKWFGFF